MNDTRTYQQADADPTPVQADNPFASDAADAEQRMSAFEEVARVVREMTAHGEAARRALEQRRNRSGQ